MPNWCSNSLTVTLKDASSEAVEQFNDFKAKMVPVEENKVRFFRTFLPMPEELANIHIGSREIDGTRWDYWRFRNKETDEYIGGDEHVVEDWVKKGTLEVVGVSQEEHRALVDKHGAGDWYEWGMNKWSCKWDACRVELITKSEEYYRVAFETPWSPPDLFCIALAKMYPKLIFRLAFAEQGNCFYGSKIFDGEAGSELYENYCEPENGFWENPEDENSQLIPEVEHFLNAYNLNPGG